MMLKDLSFTLLSPSELLTTAERLNTITTTAITDFANNHFVESVVAKAQSFR